MSTELAPIPRTPYGAVMAAASAVSVGLGVLAASAAGTGGAGGVGVVAAVAGVLVAGAMLCIIPLLGPSIIKPSVWGMAVLLVSGLRTMLAMGAMLVLIEVQGLDRRAVVYGILAGTVVMMVAEGTAAAWLLIRRERQREAGGTGGAGGSSPGAAPRGGANGSRSAA